MKINNVLTSEEIRVITGEIQITNLVFVLRYCRCNLIVARTNAVLPRLPSYRSLSVIRRHKNTKSSWNFPVFKMKWNISWQDAGVSKSHWTSWKWPSVPLIGRDLGIGWRGPSGLCLCCVPKIVLGHCRDLRKVPTLHKGINLSQSMKLLEVTNQFLPVGSGKWWNVWWRIDSQ